MQAETAFKNRVIPRLKAIPKTWVFKTQEVSKKGIPDIVMCLHGVFICIELKTDTGVVSALQEYNLEKIQKAGGISMVITPENFELKIKELEMMSKKCSITFDGKRNTF